MADRRFARPLGALALAALLAATSPALANPHQSPDLTPKLLLPRHTDFELLYQVECLSGPCYEGTVVAQSDETSSEGLDAADEGEEPAPAPSDTSGDSNAGLAQGQGPARPADNTPTGASAVLDAGALGAAGGLAAQIQIDSGPARSVGENAAPADTTSLAGEVVAATATPQLSGDIAITSGAGEERAGDIVVASLPDEVEAGVTGETEAPSSGLLELRGRQAALDEAFGVGSLASTQMSGLRRLSLSSPTMLREPPAGRPRPVVRTALRDLVGTPSRQGAGSQSPMDSDEREAVHRPQVDRRPEPRAPSEPGSPIAPRERTAPGAAPSREPEPAAPAETRAPSPAPAPGAGGGGGVTVPQEPVPEEEFVE